MIKLYYTLGLFFLFFVSDTKAEGIDGTFEVYRFQQEDKQYVELFFYVLGNTVVRQPVDSTRSKGNVEVIYLIERDGQIVGGDRLNLISPAAENPVDFMDMQRVVLQPGSYTISVEYRDGNDTSSTLSLEQSVNIEEGMLQSDIQLLSSYSKSGPEQNTFQRGPYTLEPIAFNYYHDAFSRLIFLSEIYRSDKIFKEDFLISYAIVHPDNYGDELIIAYKKLSPSPFQLILMEVDISNLTSGEYEFRLEIRKKDKELVSSKKVKFTRRNIEAGLAYAANYHSDIKESFVQSLDKKQLDYSIRAMAPIVSSQENDIINILLKNDEDDKKRNFIHQYWLGINQQDPFQAYTDYMDVAKAVDTKFAAGFGYGFEMDRGHIFLKYGMPSDIVEVEDEPSAPPYEIWVYYDFPKTNQSNVKFLFYNPSLAGNDYKLLHSTALGELNNPRWEVQLYGDAPGEISGDNAFDARRMQDNFHRNARNYFNDY